jgi:hypothetical protein
VIYLSTCILVLPFSSSFTLTLETINNFDNSDSEAFSVYSSPLSTALETAVLEVFRSRSLNIIQPY